MMPVAIAENYFKVLVSSSLNRPPVEENRIHTPELQPQQERPMNENDLNAQMHLMSTEDTTIHLPEPTLETLPDKNKIFEEYISLDGGDRDTSLQPLRFSFSTDIEPLRTVSEVKV
jgi:hypothetical protein